MRPLRTPRLDVAVALAVAVGLAAALVLAVVDGGAARFADEQFYATAARGVGTGEGFVNRSGDATAARAPVFALVLAPVAALTTGYVPLRLVGVALFGLALVLTWYLGRRIGGRTLAHLAAIVLALSPLVAYTAGTLYPQALAVALVPATAHLALTVDRRLERGERWTGPALGLGALGGVLLLTAPANVATWGAAVMWLLVRHRRRTRPRALAVAGVSLAVLVVAVTPWTVRNLVVLDAFVPVQTNAGISLVLGSLPPGGYDELEDREANERLLGDAFDAGETGANAMLIDAFGARLREDPAGVAGQYVRKVVRFLAPYDDLAEDANDGTVQRVLLTVTWLPVLALLAARLALARTGRLHMRRGEGLLLGIVAANVLLTAVFFWRVRYRVPLEPLLLVVALAPVASWLDDRCTPPELTGGRGRSQNAGPRPASGPDPAPSPAHRR